MQLVLDPLPHGLGPRLAAEQAVPQGEGAHGLMPTSRTASPIRRAYQGVPTRAVVLKSRMILICRAVFPLEAGMTEAPMRSAP